MYNVQSLSGLPSQIKVNNNKGSPQKEEKINKKKRWRSREEKGGVEWMDGSMHSPDPMQVAIPVLLIISAAPTNNTPPPHTH
jgi:hypothetical protein